LANAFGAPLILQSRFIEKSLRKEAFKKGKSIIVYEGGESLRLEEPVVQEGINGAQRLLKSLGMLSEAPVRTTPTIHIESSTWLRAKRSGIYQGIAKSGTFVKNRELLGYITDPFGEFRLKISSKQKAFVIGHNNMPIVNQGDALLHLGILKDPLTQG
jgi:predicted deacylase